MLLHVNSSAECNWCLRREDDGHGIIENTLPKEQSVQVNINFKLIEDGQHGHWDTEKRKKKKTLNG